MRTTAVFSPTKVFSGGCQVPVLCFRYLSCLSNIYLITNSASTKEPLFKGWSELISPLEYNLWWIDPTAIIVQLYEEQGNEQRTNNRGQASNSGRTGSVAMVIGKSKKQWNWQRLRCGGWGHAAKTMIHQWRWYYKKAMVTQQRGKFGARVMI